MLRAFLFHGGTDFLMDQSLFGAAFSKAAAMIATIGNLRGATQWLPSRLLR
jgi:hypothetical protein